MSTRVVTRRPAPALAPFVGSLAYFEGAPPDGMERVLPTAVPQLLVNLRDDEFRTYDGPDHATVRRIRGAALQGPHARPSVIDTAQQGSILGVGFRPGGTGPFFATGPAATRDELVELGELWGRDGATLRERLLEATTPEDRLRILEAVLLDHVVHALRPDPAMGFAVAALGRGTPVAKVAERLGLTSKSFLRRFKDTVGLTPKRFARVRRLQRTLRSIPHDRPVDWAETAAANGYYDQPHLIHEFKELAGISPSAYRPRTPGEHNHVPI